MNIECCCCCKETVTVVWCPCWAYIGLMVRHIEPRWAYVGPIDSPYEKTLRPKPSAGFRKIHMSGPLHLETWQKCLTKNGNPQPSKKKDFMWVYDLLIRFPSMWVQHRPRMAQHGPNTAQHRAKMCPTYPQHEPYKAVWITKCKIEIL